MNTCPGNFLRDVKFLLISFSGFISYPRTETNQYPTNFKFEPVIHLFKNTKAYGEAAQELLSSGCNPRKGDDKGDHPPITPQRIATESEVGGEAYRVYDYVVNHCKGQENPKRIFFQDDDSFLVVDKVTKMMQNSTLAPITCFAGFSKFFQSIHR